MQWFSQCVSAFNSRMQFLGQHISYLLLLPCLFSLNAFAQDQDFTVDGQHNMAVSASISEPWARATFALAKTGAAYFVITNNSDKPLLIEAVSIFPNIAMTAQIHHTVMQNDMMQMEELTQGVKIKSGEKVEFSPSGKHVMLMGLTGPLISGKDIVIRLHFKDGSFKDQIFPIIDKRK